MALGEEPRSDLYLDHLLEVIEEIARVLKPEGTLWLNIGDCFGHKSSRPLLTTISHADKSQGKWNRLDRTKGFCLIPERLILALAQRGWRLRNRIVWHKPNHLPTHARDRLACSWEYLLLLTRSDRYFFDLDAIRVPHVSRNAQHDPGGRRAPLPDGRVRIPKVFHPLGKNPGDVWTIATRPSPTGHPAAYPEEFCIRPIAAGCPVGGLVLDPFAGSGTTLVVARELGRRFIGFEANPRYAEAASQRLGSLDHVQEVKGGTPPGSPSQHTSARAAGRA